MPEEERRTSRLIRKLRSSEIMAKNGSFMSSSSTRNVKRWEEMKCRLCFR